MRSIGNLAREAGFSFKALSVTYLGFWDPVADKQIVTLHCVVPRARVSAYANLV